jgi:hypothetical protein
MPMTSWMKAMSESTARLEDRIRHLEIRMALVAKDLREIKKPKSAADWRSTLQAFQDSWLVRLGLLLALLTFNWQLPEAMKIIFGGH